MVKYWSSEPPEVNLGAIKVPVAMYMAEDDKIGDMIDNTKLKSKIRTVVHFEMLKDEDHLSLTFSKDMTYFKKVINLMDQYIQK